jgi:hypothetical protein
MCGTQLNMGYRAYPATRLGNGPVYTEKSRPEIGLERLTDQGWKALPIGEGYGKDESTHLCFHKTSYVVPLAPLSSTGEALALSI